MRRGAAVLWVFAVAGLAAVALRVVSGAGEEGHTTGPRILLAWAAGPFETRIAFDRPVGTEVARRVVAGTIRFGGNEASDTRGTLRIAAAGLDDGGKTLVLTTDPHPRAATYAVELPIGGNGKTIKVSYDLRGVEVSWSEEGKDDSTAWTGWWPSLDPAEVRKTPSKANGLALLEKKGKLSLNTLLVLPKGRAVVKVSSSGPVEATLNGEEPTPGTGRKIFRTESTGEPLLLSLSVGTGKGGNSLTVAVTVQDEAGRETPLEGRQLLLPWTPPSPPPPAPLENLPDLAGGDPNRGANVFKSNDAKCANCHRVRGEGGVVGPDLSNQVGRDRKDVYRDIAEPSARIHPDFVPYTLALKDGRILVGTVRAEGADAVRVSDTEAKVTVVPRAEIEEFRPSATSVMPVGLAGAIGEEKMRDLVAFLVAAPSK